MVGGYTLPFFLQLEEQIDNKSTSAITKFSFSDKLTIKFWFHNPKIFTID
jgi:hypothetical protein